MNALTLSCQKGWNSTLLVFLGDFSQKRMQTACRRVGIQPFWNNLQRVLFNYHPKMNFWFLANQKWVQVHRILEARVNLKSTGILRRILRNLPEPCEKYLLARP